MLRKTLIALFLIICLILPTLAACTGTAAPTTVSTEPRKVTLAGGTVVQVPAVVNKVAVLHGFSYEKVALLGAEDKIVMCGDYHKTLWPWAYKIFKRLNTVPAITNPSAPNLEELLKAKPDVVFFFNYQDPIKKMNDLGMAVIWPDPVSEKTVAGNSKDILKAFAQAMGKAEEKKANEYAVYFDQKLAYVTAITSKIPDSERPRTYFAVRKPLQTAGKDSCIPELVTLAGGKCVTADLAAGFGKDINMEQLLVWNPQVIFLDHLGARYLGSAPASEILTGMEKDNRLKEIDAVKTGRIHFAPTGAFFWDTGEQMILELMWMAKALHPDKFKDLDIKKEIKEFYAKFYGYSLTDDEIQRIIVNQLPEGMADTNPVK